MVEDVTDILQLRFEGNGISPKKVKPSEIAELVKQFEKAILCTIASEHPEINTDHVLFTFENVKNESLGLNFEAVKEKILPSVKNIVVSSYLFLATSIATNQYSYLTNETIDCLKNISKFSKKYSCNAQFNHNGDTISTITPTTEIQSNKTGIIKGNITIYGEIVDVGTNIHLKLNEGYNVIIDADKATSKVLGSKLWDYVGFRGSAKWDAVSSKITEFKLSEILDYNPGSIVDVFSELRDITSGVWDNYNNNDDINKQLLRD